MGGSERRAKGKRKGNEREAKGKGSERKTKRKAKRKRKRSEREAKRKGNERKMKSRKSWKKNEDQHRIRIQHFSSSRQLILLLSLSSRPYFGISCKRLRMAIL